MSFKTVNGTGTGIIALEIHTQDGIPIGDNQLMEPQDSGTYNAKWNSKAAPNPDCDPTQSPCEMWLPGNYTVTVGKNSMATVTSELFSPLSAAICNGQCGSKHPHSQIYDESSATFTVIEKN